MGRKIGSQLSLKKKPSQEPPGSKSPYVMYKTKLLTLCLLKGFKNNKKFKLTTRSKNVYFFGDIIFETIDGAVLMAVNYHDSDRSRLISFRQLFHKPYIDSIHEYARSFCKIDQLMFQIRNVRLVTTKPVTRSKIMENYLPATSISESDISYCSNECSYYTLSEKSRELLRECNNNLSEEIISDFISKFQLMSLSEKKLDEEIHLTLKSIKIVESNLVHLKEVTDYIIEEIRQRYIFAPYLDPLDNFYAAFFLSSYKSIKYAEKLKDYHISFKEFEVSKNYVLYTIAVEYYILHLIRFHQGMSRKGEKMKSIIIIDTNDSLSVQRIMVEACNVPECRILIAPLFVYSCKDLRIDEFRQQLSEDSNKRIILFSNNQNCFTTISDVEVISSRICLLDLEYNCQKTFLDTKIKFQERIVSLRDAIGPYSDANDIVDEELILMLSMKEKIEIENIQYGEEIGSLYISRMLVRDDLRCSESEMCNLVTTKNVNKFILISSDAGMGKTMILTKITDLLKDLHPHYWIIRLKLNRLSNIFRKMVQSKTKSIELEDVLNATTPVLKNSFKRNFFNIPNKVVLVIDEIDVIRSIYKSLALEFLRNCSVRTNIAKIFVSTRPHLKCFLQEKLNVSSFTLQVFSQQDQNDFLTKYWKKNLKLSQREILRAKYFARHLLEKLNQTLGRASFDLVGIPLQTRMIAEVFQEGNEQWRGCREFVISEERDVELKAHVNVAKLYEMFLEKKMDIFIGDKTEHIVVENVMMKLYKESMKIHRKMALELLLDSEKCKFFTVYRESHLANSETYIEDIGIMQRIDDEWIFLHQTFAEYFISTCISEELQMGNLHWDFLHFILNDILLPKEFSVIRMFFDDILSNINIPLEIYEAWGSIVGQTSWNESRNIVHLAEEGRLDILKLILEKCTNQKYLLHIEDVSGNTALHSATKHVSIFKYLISKGADINRTNSHGQSVLHTAIDNFDHDVAKIIFDNNVAIDCKLKNGKTLLHCVAEKNCVDMARLLIQANADLNATEQSLKTPLHTAAESNSLEIVRILVEAGADVESRTGAGHTALELAQLTGRTDIVKFLKNNPTKKYFFETQ